MLGAALNSVLLLSSRAMDYFSKYQQLGGYVQSESNKLVEFSTCSIKFILDMTFYFFVIRSAVKIVSFKRDKMRADGRDLKFKDAINFGVFLIILAQSFYIAVTLYVGKVMKFY